ncbi:unannotated protein [freshwater metagenome]|uniref:Unannotated protein n=1 Tax=freshwater metagenome TaxID=449393 RepID=A0A6J7FY66_9ZZZZ|nr:hypothetical protein [Actinomycetota bacterium]
MSTTVPDHVRAAAREVRALFDRHQELAIAMNQASSRHEAAERQLVSGLSADALRAIYGPQGPDLALSGEKPAVLQAKFPIQALEQVAYELRTAYNELHRLSEDSRINASETGAAMERMTLGLIELGLTRDDVQRIDVDQVVAGTIETPVR